ncbi:MAG: hypothetical protein Greene07147_424 [Parcubacteria group bacterium Greene0714_7]|nr:MAG: hypothetical protein Greene07147_424 [Parcubacteria group bacterium Greene0714_7]
MEKGSFWDHFWGTKRVQASGDGRLRETIAERRMQRGAEEEKARRAKELREAERIAVRKALTPEKKYPDVARLLETFLHNLRNNILRAESRGETQVELKFGSHLKSTNIEELEAFKKIKTFCNKNGFGFHYFSGIEAGFDSYEPEQWSSNPEFRRYTEHTPRKGHPASIRINF